MKDDQMIFKKKKERKKKKQEAEFFFSFFEAKRAKFKNEQSSFAIQRKNSFFCF
jgi:hypothetical protein